MQTLKNGIRGTVIKSAKQAFLQHGYEKASMKNIADNAEISKSNIYNYFHSKEDIFNFIVKKSYVEIWNKIKCFLDYDFLNLLEVDDYSKFISNEITKIIIEYRFEIILLIDCSTGTKYENFKDDLILSIEKYLIYKILDSEEDISEEIFFIHLITNNIIENIIEVIRCFREEEWTKINIERIINYHTKGFYTNINNNLISCNV